jgi:hypothetical protein
MGRPAAQPAAGGAVMMLVTCPQGVRAGQSILIQGQRGGQYQVRRGVARWLE